MIGEINQLKPRRVLDIGCGYHEFRGKIDNIIGIKEASGNYDEISKIIKNAF